MFQVLQMKMCLSGHRQSETPRISSRAQTGRGILLIVLLLLQLSLARGADTKYGPGPGTGAGAKFFRNYSRENYNSQAQNWFITRDRRGMIYSANQGGVLEYDGVSWKEIPIPGKNARSLTVDSKGTVYIGGNNEIGYLEADGNGLLRYASLTPLLDAGYRDFGYVWRSYSTENGIYFCTSKFLFLFNRHTIRVWRPETSFSLSFICGGKLLILQKERGLMEMRAGYLHLLPGGGAFAHDIIYAIVEFSKGNLLIGTAKGFFLYKDHSLIPFKTEALDTISANQLTFGLRLTDGNFAFATRKGGVFGIDSRGQLRWRFDTSLGLPDNTVWHLCEDPGQDLWLALNNGISKLEYRSPFSIYDGRHGLKGMVFSAARFGSRGRLYAGTAGGLFVMKENGMFDPVPGIGGFCRALLSGGDSLLAATERGVYRLSENNPIPQVLSDTPAYVFQATGTDRFPILAGTERGLISLSPDPRTGRWLAGKFLEEIDEEIRTMARDAQGNLWLGSLRKGVIKISFPSAPGHDNPTAPVIQRYTPRWFPPGVETHVFYAAGHIIIATGKGMFRWDEKTAGVVPDFTFGDEFAGGEKGKSVFRITEDVNQDTWFHSNGRNLAAIPQPDRTYRIYKEKFLRIPGSHVDFIYPDPLEPAVWFAGENGLLRFDTGAGLEDLPPTPFSTFIRGVWANEISISGGDARPGPEKKRLLELPFNRRSLRFSFAAPFFRAEENTLYQCRLDGYDPGWTAWSSETRKDYTNLEPGLNVFRVRAKNIYGHIGAQAVFRFTILPPWYRTWWAFLIYAAAAFFCMFLIIKWRSRKLVREKQRLEQIILERTKEIKRQSEKLEEMANVKSRFFANISHEFRTPLTLIMGPLEQMLTAPQEEGKEQKKKMRLMLRNSQRLLDLINQLLELSRFDSGTMKLQAARQDIVPFLKGVFHSFDSLAVQREMELIFQTGAEDISLYYDPVRLEEVIFNLVSNAIKFTPAGGRITLAVEVREALPGKDGMEGQDFLEVSVSDTGPGIPQEELAHIFDRFYQADSTYAYHRQGTGIGLAIAREIVELHHGTITAYSPGREGSGSLFVIRLPMGSVHLKPEEIVESIPSPKKSGHPAPDVKEYEEEESEPLKKGEETGQGAVPQEKDIILVVEDSADVREYIRGALEPQYLVKEAKDGEEGLRQAGEIVPDLIICDVMMPGKDGFEVCREIKNDRATSHIPVILLTARAGEDSIVQGLEAGADDYITKPFSTRILLARIKNLIDLRRQSQQNLGREMTLQPAKAAVSRIDQEFLKDMQNVINENLSDTEFNVDQLSRKLYMSHATVYRKIHALTGENPGDFIRTCRLKRGAELLKAGKGNVGEVAFEVGFSSTSYFIKCFKEKFQQLPSEYQERKGMMNDE